MNDRNILILGGHLDDSVLALGGTIRKYTQAGYSVSVVCFGNGDEGFADLAERGQVVEKFKREAVAAHQVLGVTDLVCHDWPDFAVRENREIYRYCIAAIRRVKPAVIFGHYPLEYFQHRAMARITEDAWYQAGWACSADLGAPHLAGALYQFEVLQPMPNPTHLIDVSDTFEAKLEAWAQFKCGQEHLDSAFDQLTARARFRGSQIGVKYAEAVTRSAFLPQPVGDLSQLEIGGKA